MAGDGGVTTTPADHGADGWPRQDQQPRQDRELPQGGDTGQDTGQDQAQGPDRAQSHTPGASLQVRLNDDPALGFCIYALRHYSRGEVLFSERTALEATHDVYKTGDRNVYQVYSRLSPARKTRLHGSFPYLAWANGIDARAAAEARTLIDSNLLTKGVVIDNRLTAADHMRMRPDFDELMAAAAAAAEAPGGPPGGAGAEGGGGGGPALAPDSPAATGSNRDADGGQADWAKLPTAAIVSRALSAVSGVFTPVKKSGDGWPFSPGDGKLSPDGADKAALARRETVEWFSRYAFRLKPEHAFSKAGNHYQAAVYLLTDLINHRCAGYQNCKVVTDVGKVKVVAERDIAPGQEVTINYSKDVKDFRCKGECCQGKPQQSTS